MNILTLDGISKVYTERKVLDNASFYLQEGEKVGVIGVNGTGKSTLLHMIAGTEEPDAGEIIRANHISVRFLPQMPEFLEDETVVEYVVRQNKTETNQWDVESQAKSMLLEVGVSDWEAKCSKLSGGQKKRVALASVLLEKADVLVLDEPTNHIDSATADWLEGVLKGYRGSIVMVTHDRYFLDSVCNRIVEIDKGNIYSYDANYEGYLALKLEREEMALASERKRQSILRTELAWVMRGARARSTKQKSRLQRYEEMKSIEKIKEDEKVVLSSISSRLGKTTLEAHSLKKAYGEKVLIDDFSYIFLRDDRIGFVGENGCGKTTLMQILTGRCKPDSGEIVVGQTVKIGYYSQDIYFTTEKTNEENAVVFHPEDKVIDVVKDVAEYVETREGTVSASAMLERFLFPSHMQYSKVSKLSGGEKRRLQLLRVLMKAPNVLILDEPTNDLDITTLTILEDYLDSFDGIVIVVSHDRYFLDRTVRRIFAFEGNGKIQAYEGGYTDYILRRKETEGEPKKVIKKDNESGTKYPNGREKKLKFTYQEQKDYESIEGELEQIAEKLTAIDEEMLKAAKDFVKLNELMKEKEELEKLQEEKMERWMYLEELAEKIATGS